MKYFYTILALLIYVQSFALYGLRDYSCCGSHTRTEIKAKKVLSCCSHDKHSCSSDKVKTTEKKSGDHNTCSGDMCKCVSCHVSLVYLPFWSSQPENQNIPIRYSTVSFAYDHLLGNDYCRALLQPPRFI